MYASLKLKNNPQHLEKSMANTDELGLMRLRDPNEAAGLAIRLLAGESPFREMPLGMSAGTMLNAIDRDHYAFARRGDRAVGFTCWMFTDVATAEAWMHEGTPLGADAANEDGAAAIVLAVQAIDAKVTRFLLHALRDIELAERSVCYFLRDYGPDKPRRLVRLVRPVSRGRSPAS